MTINTKQNDGVFKSVMMAYMVLLLHVLLIAGLGLLVLFFRGFIQYIIWIFLGGAAAIFISGYRIFKRMREEGKTLRETLGLPGSDGRPIEISILGGMATFRIGRDTALPPALPDVSFPQPHHLLEDPAAIRVRELTDLARMLENNLITLEEFNTVKSRLFQS
jgi:hypothetical protein